MKWLEIEEESHGLGEVAALLGYDHVDGVEVLPAAEAPGEVCPGIRRRVELPAERAEETEDALGYLSRDLKDVADESRNRNVVSERAQKLRGVPVAHDRLLAHGRWNSAAVSLTRASEIFCWLREAALRRQAVA